jgi:hypothetical protein
MVHICADCGEAEAVDELNIPFEWTQYLRKKRDYGPPLGSVWIPLCRDCHMDADQLKETQHDLGYYDDETRESVESDITEFLDRLNLGELIDRP